MPSQATAELIHRQIAQTFTEELGTRVALHRSLGRQVLERGVVGTVRISMAIYPETQAPTSVIPPNRIGSLIGDSVPAAVAALVPLGRFPPHWMRWSPDRMLGAYSRHINIGGLRTRQHSCGLRSSDVEQLQAHPVRNCRRRDRGRGPDR